MDDLISRQAAIDALEEPCKVSDTWTDECAIGERMQWEKDIKALNSLPSADVKPVRHGKWIPKFNGQFKGGAYWFDCSVCGRIVPDVRNGGWNYCPNCGATMRGE